jgi:putative oxidoreductase
MGKSGISAVQSAGTGEVKIMKKIAGILSNKFVLAFLKLALGFIFIVASLGKIIDPAGFAKDVYSYVLLPDVIVPLFAAVVPWIEFTAGLLLMLDMMPQSCALIINGLLAIFIWAIAIDVHRGIEISCGCFDFLFPKEEIGWNTIIRDLIMLLAGIPILFFDQNDVKLYGLINKKVILNNKKTGNKLAGKMEARS